MSGTATRTHADEDGSEASDDAEAKGTPHSDRQATETAAGRHEGGGPAEQKSE
jgi:hypothetical protein